MKKPSVICGIVVGIGLLLTGCGNSFDHMPDLTEEESALIAEYAAGILLKHDGNVGKLASDAEIAAFNEREALLAANTAQFLAEEQKEENAEAASGGEKNEAAAPVEASFENIAQFCGAEGFQIDYMDHLICDSYPEGNGTDMVFAMDATEGNKLLVLRFAVENLTAEDKELDMIDQGVRFRISVNGGRAESALSTLLLDDLSSYKDTIPANTAVVLVLTREVTEEEANAVSGISLSMRNVSGNATTLLE